MSTVVAIMIVGLLIALAAIRFLKKGFVASGCLMLFGGLGIFSHRFVEVIFDPGWPQDVSSSYETFETYLLAMTLYMHASMLMIATGILALSFQVGSYNKPLKNDAEKRAF